MTQPREVIAGRFYLVTRRCSRGQFLMRPDPTTNRIWEYCLGEAVRAYGITVVGDCVMSNHYHTVIFDRHGNYPEFLAYLHGLFARCMNAWRGRRDHFWDARQTSVVMLADEGALIRELVYTFTNPVTALLVDEIGSWPGVNGLARLMSGRERRVKRPRKFFRRGREEALPEETVLRREVPADAIPDRERFLARLQRAVDRRLGELAAYRARAGLRCLGRRAVRETSWRQAEEEKPHTKRDRNGISPRVATRDVERRKEALRRMGAFRRRYADALVAWFDGEECVFPEGTYWLARYARAPLEGPRPRRWRLVRDRDG
ncbi:MAG TPA: hypothetical protein VFQ53_25610 [Kofleriaceae bacterium]|nr:hypothetical protein [Kofleriaceae bacterium]